ncbi:metal-dependent hydrolase [Fodinibius halophilus]|uniref:Metal-dependent hydrolase n=1 Tax=Fodinibius halophilus TaxID=1736908 RepID=A0A6M1T6C8_9BACT|nr:metal-dependent hydrolase [Fodinibius halophilus]NGP88855.1 metal-dependent hydrolase [Fodinibius halophilus]
MDPVTHGLIGASATQSISSKKEHRYAAISGLLAAMLADLDILISDSSDPLLNIELHRQFSHSIIFIPFGALITAGLLWWFMRDKLPFKRLYLFSLLGYATSGITDSLTSYGTKLLWPFLDERFSWNIISVFDPLFSIGVLTAVGLAFYYRNRKSAQLAWAWIFIYLLFGMLQHERGQSIAQELSSKRNHKIERLVVKPTIANTLLWSIRYEANDTLYADGVHLMPFTKATIYEGNAAPMLDWQEKYDSYRGTTLYKDIKRFNTLSDGYLIQHPRHSNIIGDGRYALLPTAINPLWGIEVDTTNTAEHTPFKTFRNPTPKVRTTFIDMLLGRSL